MNRGLNNIKLGAFVVSGLAFLIFMLYMIGRNQNLFQSTYMLKAQVRNAQGLVTGNNVRYSGIEIGTVKKIRFINDTLIELSLTISSKMENIIRKDAKVSIGSEGLVGNRVLNITASGKGGVAAVEGDVLTASYSVSTDDMLIVLEKTNNDVAVVAAKLRSTIDRLNTSNGLWKVLEDEKCAENIRITADNIRKASANVNVVLQNMQNASASLTQGNGAMAMLLRDTNTVSDIRHSLKGIKNTAINMDSLTGNLNRYATDIYNEINEGNNTLNVLLRDSLQAEKMRVSMGNVEKGTASFITNMEALRHNILFRGYFKRIEKKRKKDQKTNVVSTANTANK